MRIVTITTDPNAGGSSKSLLNLLIGLKKHGHDIMVILPKEGFLSDNLRIHNIRFEIVSTVRMSIWPKCSSLMDVITFVPHILYNQICHINARNRIKSIVQHFNTQIIHSNVSLLSDGYVVASKLGIKHVWHIREYGDLDFGLKIYPSKTQLMKRLKNGNTIAITQGIKNHYDLSDKCRVIFNGIRSKDFDPKNPHKENYYLFVGHVNDNKGVNELIKAFISYRSAGGQKRLKIAGNCDTLYQENLLKQLRKSNHEKYVDFLGQRSDVDELMQRAVALVVPSKFEAFGRITAEAMFNDCLVIGKNTAGTKEQIELVNNEAKKKVAYLYNGSEELKNFLLETDNLDISSYHEMILAAKQIVIKKFSIERNINMTEEYLNYILDSNKNIDNE